MSFRDIIGQAVDALRRGEPMTIRLANGTVVSGVPEETRDENGRTIIAFHVESDGDKGPIWGTLYMRPDTFEHMLDQTERMAPRLTMVQRRMLTR